VRTQKSPRRAIDGSDVRAESWLGGAGGNGSGPPNNQVGHLPALGVVEEPFRAGSVELSLADVAVVVQVDALHDVGSELHTAVGGRSFVALRAGALAGWDVTTGFVWAIAAVPTTAIKAAAAIA
jgi:hypothetical protein